MTEAFNRLWVGTSVGTILLYQLPQQAHGGIPVVSGKPYMATKGHDDAIRIIVPVAAVPTDLEGSENCMEPATLPLGEGCVTSSELIVQPKGTVVSAKAARSQSGPMYVLTAGRSSNPQAQSASTSTINIREGEARVCVVAYEIEDSQVD